MARSSPAVKGTSDKLGGLGALREPVRYIRTRTPVLPRHQRTGGVLDAIRAMQAGEGREQLCRSNLAAFCSYKLRGEPDPEDPRPAFARGERFLIGPHHVRWAHIASNFRRACVLAARDHSKSMFFSKGYPLWQSWRRPKSRGYLFSGSADQAYEKSEIIEREVLENPELAQLRPYKGCVWNKGHREFGNGSWIRFRGFGAKSRGGHPGWAVLDDILNDEHAYSELVRRKEINYFLQAISNMVHTRGQIICVGTPFSKQDLYHVLKGKKAYHFEEFPAYDKFGIPLWAARYSIEDLEAKREEIGPLAFTREFMLVPASDDISLFPSTLFEGDCVVPHCRLGMERRYWRSAGIEYIYQSVDIALSAAQGSDYFVIWTVGLDRFGNRWILDVFRERGVPYRNQKSLIIKYGRKWNPVSITIESNQAQQIWGDELILDTDLPIVPYKTSAEKHHLAKGIPAMLMLLENGKFKMPHGDEKSAEMMRTWADEMHNFVLVNGKVTSIGVHDDLAMASYLAEVGIRESGRFDFSFEATHDDAFEAALEDLDMGRPGPLVIPGAAPGSEVVFSLDQIDRLVSVGEDELDDDEDETGFHPDQFSGAPSGLGMLGGAGRAGFTEYAWV